MFFLKDRLLGTARGGGQLISAEQQQCQLLLTRLESSQLAEQKRKSLEELRALAKEFPLLPMEAPALLLITRVMRQEKADVDLARGGVELLLTLMQGAARGGEASAQSSSSEEAGNHSEAGNDSEAFSASSEAAAMIVRNFCQEPENITLLLDMLTIRDLYCRYFTIQLLTVLLLGMTRHVQKVVLDYPMGVNLLMEMLSDRREIIRNEILLLLDALTKSNGDIQKIVAFNGAFEALLGIAREEGYFEGGIIVQDCLCIVQTLLRENPSNQKFFCEMGNVSLLVPLLIIPRNLKLQDQEDFDQHVGRDHGEAQSESVKEDHLVIISMAVEIVQYLLMGAEAAASDDARTSMLNSLTPLLPFLFQLGSSSSSPLAMRQQAFALLAGCVFGNSRNQEALAQLTVFTPSLAVIVPRLHSRRVQSGLRVVLLVALFAEEATERLAAELVLAAFFENNLDGKRRAGLSFMPRPDAGLEGSALDVQRVEDLDEFDRGVNALGAVLADALQGGSHRVTSLIGGNLADSALGIGGSIVTSDSSANLQIAAARVIQLILRHNVDGKIMLFRIPLTYSAVPTRLIDKFIALLFGTQRPPADDEVVSLHLMKRLQVTLLVLLCEWLHECPELMAQTFSMPNFLPFLLGLASMPDSVSSANSSSVNPDDTQVHVRGLATYAVALSLDLFAPVEEGGGPSASKSVDGNSGGGSSVDPKMVLNIVTQKIGLDRFKHNLYKFSQTREFDAGCHVPVMPFRSFRHVIASLNDKHGTELTQGDLPILFDSYFTSLFKVVQIRCDKRVLALFSLVASLPSSSSSSFAAFDDRRAVVTNADTEATQNQSSANVQHIQQRVASLEAALNEAQSANRQLLSAAAQARGEVEQLQAEASTFKQAHLAEMNSARNQILQLQQQQQQCLNSLEIKDQQLLQLQERYSRVMQHGGGGTSADYAGGGYEKLQRQYTELISEHEDLLILLAEMDRAALLPPHR